MAKVKRSVREAHDGPDKPIDKSLIDEKPKAQWKGIGGGDIKVPKVKWKADKNDRKNAKRTAVALKNARKNQLERKRFRTPIKSAYSYNKVSIMNENDARRQRAIARGLIRIPNKPLEANGQSRVILAVRNSYPYPGDETTKVLSNLGIENKFHAAIIPNTGDNISMLYKMKKYVFYGCPTPEVLSQVILKHGCLWKTVDESTVDLFTAHRKAVGEKIDWENDVAVMNDNTEIENRMGYLDIICFEDLIAGIIGGDVTTLPTIIKHLGPVRLLSYQKAVQDVLEFKHQRGWIKEVELDNVLKKLI